MRKPKILCMTTNIFLQLGPEPRCHRLVLRVRKGCRMKEVEILSCLRKGSRISGRINAAHLSIADTRYEDPEFRRSVP